MTSSRHRATLPCCLCSAWPVAPQHPKSPAEHKISMGGGNVCKESIFFFFLMANAVSAESRDTGGRRGVSCVSARHQEDAVGREDSCKWWIAYTGWAQGDGWMWPRVSAGSLWKLHDPLLLSPQACTLYNPRISSHCLASQGDAGRRGGERAELRKPFF